MESLERLGFAENTLVIFTSDNGPEVTTAYHMRTDHGHDGARPWRGVKRDQWEGGHRVPALAWGGPVAAGVREEMVSTLDLYPTIVDLAGGSLAKDR